MWFKVILSNLPHLKYWLLSCKMGGWHISHDVYCRPIRLTPVYLSQRQGPINVSRRIRYSRAISVILYPDTTPAVSKVSQITQGSTFTYFNAGKRAIILVTSWLKGARKLTTGKPMRTTPPTWLISQASNPWDWTALQFVECYRFDLFRLHRWKKQFDWTIVLNLHL